MKKTGIMNSELSKIVASVGHTDIIAVVDSGYPIPKHVYRVDLALKKNVPSILETVQEIAKELSIEKITFADESQQHCPELIRDILEAAENPEAASISHNAFKELVHTAAAVIRTGECIPFSNVILHGGVAF
jgi:D-ribose pyranase